MPEVTESNEASVQRVLGEPPHRAARPGAAGPQLAQDEAARQVRLSLQDETEGAFNALALNTVF